jgi:SAM-dependent methyltransferase
MDGYSINTYGDGFADVYDRWYTDMGDLAGCVDRLAELADDRPVLELGVGTGRVAVALAARVPAYTGIDASPRMLARLRAKPGADRLTLVEGDMAEVGVPADARFGLAWFSYNTFFNLTSPELQQACLERLHRVLAADGLVVIEGFVPDDDPAETQGVVVPTRMTVDTVVLTATLRDPTDQTIRGQHIELVDGRAELHPWFIRYTRPAQLDEMAGVAGFELAHRWAGWRDEPFDDTSAHHVSVYRRPP